MMKAVILAGGYGTRISEESQLKPKPMIEIGGMPILWHIMKIYSNYKINDFIICCGYKGNMIKEYFNKSEFPEWNIELVDTGLDTMTGGRIKRIEKLIDDTFCLTYGDGLSNVTLTAIHPPERFGVLTLSNNFVTEFNEKHTGESSWINGGFFVFETELFDYLKDGDMTILEKAPLETLAKEQRLTAFKHTDFWYPMDTLRDKNYLENLWTSQKAPWKYGNENKKTLQ